MKPKNKPASMNWDSLFDRLASGPSKAVDKMSAQTSWLPLRTLLGINCLHLQCCAAASRVCCWPQQDQARVNEASNAKGTCHPYVKWMRWHFIEHGNFLPIWCDQTLVTHPVLAGSRMRDLLIKEIPEPGHVGTQH